MTDQQLSKIRTALAETGERAWLLYNFRDSNAIASRVLGYGPDTHQTRRWVVLVPIEGRPIGLYHRIETHLADGFIGHVEWYSSQDEFEEKLARMLASYDRVAMEYSPENAIPVVARVDAGTIELVRRNGVQVVSSGELIARLESRLSVDQIASAVRAGKACREVMMGAFDFIRRTIESGGALTEFDVTNHILAELEHHGLDPDHGPICAVDANSANPHYAPTAEKSSPIRRDSFVLVDLWGREMSTPGSVFGDITWTAYAGGSVPEEHASVFEIVRSARDAALDRLREAFAKGEPVTGADLDDATRGVIERAGYGQYFVHRTGHSITTDLHGAGTNLDNFETRDTRPILPSTSFSIEPGIYLPGRFGIRSEIDAIVTESGEVLVSSEPAQSEVIALFA